MQVGFPECCSCPGGGAVWVSQPHPHPCAGDGKERSTYMESSASPAAIPLHPLSILAQVMVSSVI